MLRRIWDRLLSINIALAAAALFASGILHILATLATPHLMPSSGYKQLARGLPKNKMQVLPAITPDAQPLPYLSPDAHYAICRFDTKDGAVTLSALLPEPGWLLALYTPSGDNFFTTVASPERRPTVSLMLVPGIETWRAGGADVAVTGESTLTIPANRGIAVIRAPDRGQAFEVQAMAELKRAKCQFRKSPAL